MRTTFVVRISIYSIMEDTGYEAKSIFTLQIIGGSTVLLPSGKTGWRNHGVIQLKDEEIAVVRYLIKETTEEDLIVKMEKEVTRTKDELKTFVQNVIAKLYESGAIIE